MLRLNSIAALQKQLKVLRLVTVMLSVPRNSMEVNNKNDFN